MGFLLTMLPHHLKLKSVSKMEVFLLSLDFCCVPIAAHWMKMELSAILFVFPLLLFNFYAFRRKVYQQFNSMPVEFMMIFIVMFFTLWVACCLTAEAFGASLATPWVLMMKSYVNMGFVSLLLCCVGCYLFPKMMKITRDPCPKSVLLWPILLFVGSFPVQYLWTDVDGFTSVRLAYAMRLIGLLIPLSFRLHLFKWPKFESWFLVSIWCSFWCIIIGHLLTVISPAQKVSWDHVIYITGFLWVALLMSPRVASAHGGDPEFVHHRKGLFKVMGFCIILAMLSRIAPELMESNRWRHMSYASLMVGIVFLGQFIFCGKFIFSQPPLGQGH